MMEKKGIVAPEVTPPEDGGAPAQIKRAENQTHRRNAEEIEKLDADFRKTAAEATRKSLR
jgi:hypothetical protein